jgi:hypothetical protein
MATASRNTTLRSLIGVFTLVAISLTGCAPADSDSTPAPATVEQTPAATVELEPGTVVEKDAELADGQKAYELPDDTFVVVDRYLPLPPAVQVAENARAAAQALDADATSSLTQSAIDSVALQPGTPTGKQMLVLFSIQGYETWDDVRDGPVSTFYLIACGGEYLQRIHPENGDINNVIARAQTFSRAGFFGSEAHGAFWAGDENSTWEAFRWSMFAGLSASAGGILYRGWDFAGFSGDIPTSELYLRSAAAAAFVPIMQHHFEFNHHCTPSRDRTPWNIAERTGDDQVIPMFRRINDIPERLVPYLAAQARVSIATGAPLMRPLYLDVADDARIREFPLQWMLGRDLLVAPVLEEGVTE